MISREMTVHLLSVLVSNSYPFSFVKRVTKTKNLLWCYHTSKGNQPNNRVYELFSDLTPQDHI